MIAVILISLRANHPRAPDMAHVGGQHHPLAQLLRRYARSPSALAASAEIRQANHF
jgi:hypothetical protein